MNIDKLQQWIETANKNEEQIYHRGHLVEDKNEVEWIGPKKGGKYVPTDRALDVKKKANAMYASFENHQVALFQRIVKHSPNQRTAPVYEYVAKKL